MNIHYKIVEVWPQDHLIVARFWTDILSEEFLASGPDRKEDGTPVRCRSDISLTLPIPAPNGEDLEKLILNNAPIVWLQTLEDVHNPNIDTNLNELQDLVGMTKVKSLKEIQKIVGSGSNTEQLSDADITALIEKLKES
jgi:hypothetical protein